MVRDYSMRGSANLRITRDIDPESEQPVAFKTHIGWMEEERTIWLDGRPHPPGNRRSHLGGFLHRRVGRQHAHHHHHASEAQLPAPQRHPAQR